MYYQIITTVRNEKGKMRLQRIGRRERGHLCLPASEGNEEHILSHYKPLRDSA